MSHKLYFVLILLLSSVGNALAQKKDSLLHIKINLSALVQKPEKVIIEKKMLDGFIVTSDTIKIDLGNVEKTYEAPEPMFYTFKLQWSGSKATNINHWLTSGEFKLTYNTESNFITELSDNSFGKRVIDMDLKIKEFNQISDQLIAKVNYENRNIRDVEEEITKIKDSVENQIDQKIYKKLYEENLENAFGFYALLQYAQRPFTNQRYKDNPDKVEQLLNNLDKKLLLLPSAKSLLAKISIAKQLSVGSKFKYITLSDTSGKEIDLMISRGRYVLIDFWASWCGPCRAEHPYFINAFKQYNPSGFQIISISRDEVSAKNMWLKAIKADKIDKWINLIDSGNLAKRTYGIEFLPTNYLIDPNGYIIARDLRGSDLIKILSNIFP